MFVSLLLLLSSSSLLSLPHTTSSKKPTRTSSRRWCANNIANARNHTVRRRGGVVGCEHVSRGIDWENKKTHCTHNRHAAASRRGAVAGGVQQLTSARRTHIVEEPSLAGLVVGDLDRRRTDVHPGNVVAKRGEVEGVPPVPTPQLQNLRASERASEPVATVAVLLLRGHACTRACAGLVVCFVRAGTAPTGSPLPPIAKHSGPAAACERLRYVGTHTLAPATPVRTGGRCRTLALREGRATVGPGTT
jgi:hypothetical protein